METFTLIAHFNKWKTVGKGTKVTGKKLEVTFDAERMPDELEQRDIVKDYLTEKGINFMNITVISCTSTTNP